MHYHYPMKTGFETELETYCGLLVSFKESTRNPKKVTCTNCLWRIGRGGN